MEVYHSANLFVWKRFLIRAKAFTHGHSSKMWFRSRLQWRWCGNRDGWLLYRQYRLIPRDNIPLTHPKCCFYTFTVPVDLRTLTTWVVQPCFDTMLLGSCLYHVAANMKRVDPLNPSASFFSPRNPFLLLHMSALSVLSYIRCLIGLRLYLLRLPRA